MNLTLVQGAIEDPPIRRQQVDLLVYNASLHYASDINFCLASGVGLLRSGGALIIMDSPVVDKGPVPERQWGGGRKLEKGRLLAALESAGLNYKYVTIQRSISWRLRQFRTKLRGDLSFDFPLIIAWLD